MDLEIIKLYNDGYGIPSIAKKLNTNKSFVRKILLQHNVKIRTRSESQKLSLKLGHSAHPTKGKNRSDEVKNKIGKTVFDKFSQLSDEEKKERSQIHKDAWNELPLEKRKEIQKLGSEGIRNAAKNGSRLEKLIVDVLIENGYKVIWHKQGDLASSKMETDIILPTNNIAIEVDGPSHFDPIWGADKLVKNQQADSRKNGLLISKGYKVIRIKNNLTSFSKIRINLVKTLILELIQNVISSAQTYFEVEVG